MKGLYPSSYYYKWISFQQLNTLLELIMPVETHVTFKINTENRRVLPPEVETLSQ